MIKRSVFMKQRRRFVLVKLMAGLAGLALLLVAGGFLAFATGLPQARGTGFMPPQSEAIIVLTGGSGRVEAGLDLLRAGAAPHMLISGVHPDATARDILIQNNLGNELDTLGPRIALGHQARDTIGNAREAGRFVANRDIASVILVTSTYHMPRALAEFQASGLFRRTGITTWPVEPEDEQLAQWWRSQAGARLVVTEYLKYLAARMRHLSRRIMRMISESP